VGRKRIARLMRNAGLQGVSRRKWCRTTQRDERNRPAPDLVEREFRADGPDRLWVADITYIPTWAGFLYLAVVLDVWSRRIVGWSMATHLRTELVLDALEMAIKQRQPSSVIHHSDQGCQYTSVAFGQRCAQADIRPSMGSVGDCFDNAMCESFFATLECELLDRYRFHTQAEARLRVFQYIEGFYNPRRRHSALDYLSSITRNCDTRRRSPPQVRNRLRNRVNSNRHQRPANARPRRTLARRTDGRFRLIDGDAQHPRCSTTCTAIVGAARY
jgi:putative transposase